MAEDFTLRESIQLAITTEQLGQRFYEGLARKFAEDKIVSEVFAQLAEELRKAGELVEAIRVCRDGLTRHTNYPSARMTLGRALLDLGDLPAARLEFAAVLKGAPDNILAGRFLGECLEDVRDGDNPRFRR